MCPDVTSGRLIGVFGLYTNVFFICMLQLQSQSGLAALIVVVIIGAAVLVMAKSVSFLSMGEIDMAYTSVKGEEALVIAEGCAEETLRRFQLDENYSASDYVLSLGGGQCVINTSADNDERTINVIGRVDNYYKRIRVGIIATSSTVMVNSWEEY